MLAPGRDGLSTRRDMIPAPAKALQEELNHEMSIESREKGVVRRKAECRWAGLRVKRASKCRTSGVTVNPRMAGP